MEHKDRRLILALIGLPLLLLGVFCAFLGPVELYVYYLFSEGGRFYYPGFGFGSFMFGNIAVQIAGYYIIAAVFIPLGFAHLRLRRWARIIALVLLRFWLVLGVPLILVFIFMLFSIKELTPLVAGLVLFFLALSYPLAPWVLLRFYQSEDVQLTFENRDENVYGIEKIPLPILVLGALYVLYWLGLHVPIFFNGVLPFFSAWLTGLTGITGLAVLIVVLAGLTWGVLTRKSWAWWTSLIYFGLLIVSVVWTLAVTSFQEMLVQMNFPDFEMEIFQGMPFQGWYFAVFFGIPLVVTWVVIFRTKRYLK
jgi:hypothetical protein